ncbi:female sterile (1) Nasrat [Rhynchophorus ferrugineus]|uniref:female sterile (1) Nasrat n=1 Tax=Rhynchophorus ferrugineus TaxID=354439 RepID=UPI003FCD36A0
MLKSLYQICNLLLIFVPCSSLDNDWLAYENTFKNTNREEIYIERVAASYQLNFTALRWKSLNNGKVSYNVGILNATSLAIIFAEKVRSLPQIRSLTKDLNTSITDINIYHTRKNGKDESIIIVYNREQYKLLWYTLQSSDLINVWTWTLEKTLSHFSFTKIGNRDVLVTVGTNSLNTTSLDIYEFTIKPFNRWFYQAIHLYEPAASVAINNIGTHCYLSVPQPSLNFVEIYQLDKNRFIPFQNITSFQVDQVVAFENGFKSFIAFNGLNASIYQIRQSEMVKEDVKNSHMYGIQYLKAIPIQTYRDETLLLAQREVSYDLHTSLKVDVFTYNGNRFEQHEDIPCVIFNETYDGLSCLLETNLSTGLIGSGFITLLDYLGLVIPKVNNASLILNIDVNIRKIDHPKEETMNNLKQLRDNLDKIITKQKIEYENIINPQSHNSDRFEESQNVSSSPILKLSLDEGSSNDELNKLKMEIESLKAEVDGFKFEPLSGKFDSITFNNLVEINGKLQTDSIDTIYMGKEDATALLQDIARKDLLQNVTGEKLFKILTVDNIVFENVNGVEANQFLYNSSNHYELDGNLDISSITQVSNVLLTSGVINDIDITREWVDIHNITDPLNIEMLTSSNNSNIKFLNNFNTSSMSPSILPLTWKQDQIYIPGNLTVENINGVQNVEEFFKTLCYKPFKCHITDLSISGMLNITGNASTDYLNKLKYPEDYVSLSSNDDTLLITGEKIFNDVVRGYKVSTETMINDIDLNDLVTLNTDQKISGNITFNNLEIISEINIDGDIKGDQLEKFIPNLDLQDTRRIIANVSFNQLQVEGNIIIDSINDTDVDSFFNNFIFQDETAVIIKGQKQFTQSFSVRKNLNIDSNTINNIPISSFITKDTEQYLEITNFLSTVDFENLTLDGLLNGENITQIYNHFINSDRGPTKYSKFIFKEPVVVENMTFDILNDFNWNATETDNIDDDFNETELIDNVEVDDLVIEGDFLGNIVNFDVEQLENYLSYVERQDIDALYSTEKLSVDDIEITRINDFDYKSLLSYETLRGNISNILMYLDNINIVDLYVHGYLYINSINNHDFESSLNEDMWVKLYRSNSNIVDLTINGDAYFDSVKIRTLSSVNFDKLVDNIVFKNENSVKIQDGLVFEKGINVKKLLEIDEINDIKLENVLRKEGKQKIVGTTLIQGDVSIKDDLSISGLLNNVNVDEVFTNINFNQSSIIMKGEVMFRRNVYVNNLTLHGNINGIYMSDLLDNLVYTDKDITLSKSTIFKNSVSINKNLVISGDINGVKLSDFANDMVLVTKDAIIEGHVKFLSPVGIQKTFNIDRKLETNKLFGESLTDYLNDAVFVTKGRLTGTYNFKNVFIHENLNTKYVNNISMDAIVPLKSTQVIKNLIFDELIVANNVSVANKVNGIDLMTEKSRTLLANVPQDIPSDIVFLNNVLIENKLTTPAINNKPTSKIVYTNTDQILNGIYSFNAQDWTASNLNIHGLINGIDIVQWNRSFIPLNSTKMEIVQNPWTIIENINLIDVVEGNGTLNGINLKQFITDANFKENRRFGLVKGLTDDYNNICTDISYIHEKTKNQIYKFKYFKRYQTIYLNQNIKYVKPYNHETKHYLLVQEAGSCYTDLYLFTDDGYHKVERTDTGSIGQAEIIKSNKGLFIVTRSDERENLVCKIRYSTVVWTFLNETLEFLGSYDDQQLLHSSEIPLTVYGLRHSTVTEFKVVVNGLKHLRPYRRWKIESENVAFFPRGFKTGLAMRNGQIIQFLTRNDPIVEDDFGIDTEAPIIGNVSVVYNSIIPGKNGAELTVTKVGTISSSKTMLVVSVHKTAQVQQNLDLVEIYSDPFKNELFDKISAYKPSSITSMEFNNGETLLAFIEDNKVLHIYEYKGVEGFKHRSSIKMQASKLFELELPIKYHPKPRKVLGVIYKNSLTLLEAVMVGNKIDSDLSCTEM